MSVDLAHHEIFGAKVGEGGKMKSKLFRDQDQDKNLLMNRQN